MTATLEPRFDKDRPDDQPFSTATPVGKIEVGITRHELMNTFEPGKDYYVDFTPVADDKASKADKAEASAKDEPTPSSASEAPTPADVAASSQG